MEDKITVSSCHRIMLGTSNVYLVQGEDGFIMIDAGNPFMVNRFNKQLAKLGISPRSIKLIVVTHVHFDHVGSLKEIKEACDCPILVHEKESQLLKSGQISFPLPSTQLDVMIAEDTSLNDFGINGKVMLTPGHTAGSISVLLSSGEAFVGDLAINYMPFKDGPIFPPFADDVNTLMISWKKLLDGGVNKIFPGHGRPFSVEQMLRKYNEITR
jgi:glyoxylase-like metal-dependent hydrolase (beta-lactamase superfamily II)